MSITSIQKQAWLHLTRVIQDLLHVHAFLERKNRYAFAHNIHDNIQKMTSKQQSIIFGRVMTSKTLTKMSALKITSRIAD